MTNPRMTNRETCGLPADGGNILALTLTGE